MILPLPGRHPASNCTQAHESLSILDHGVGSLLDEPVFRASPAAPTPADLGAATEYLGDNIDLVVALLPRAFF